jgi:Tfp pilus assembly protein PilF
LSIGTRENIWLIRSAGTVKGPFTKPEVENLLSTRELVVIDEIAEPMGSWKPIRDKIEFAKIVEILRLKTIEASEGATKFGLDDSHTMNILDEKDEITGEYVLENLTGNENATKDNQPVKSFGLNASKEALILASQQKSKVWKTVVLLIIFSLSYVIYDTFVASEGKKILSAKQYLDVANRQLSIGNYASALDNYKEAYDIQPNNLSIHLYLGILYIQVDQSYLLGRKLLINVIEKKGPFIKLAETGVGLSYLLEMDYSSAEKHFQKAITIDQNYTPVFANLGTLKYFEGKYTEAIEYLTASLEDGEKDAGVRLILTLAYLKQWENSPQLRYLVEGQKTILKNTESQNPYFQQSLMLQTYIESILGDRYVTDIEVFNILNISPNLTENFKKNLFIDRRIIEWEAIEPWCENLVQRVLGVHSSVLGAYCQIKVGNTKMALKALESQLLKLPEDSLLLSIYSYALYVSGRQSEAKVSSGRAVEVDSKVNVKLAYLMQANYCEISQDLECVRLNLEKVLIKEPKNIVALTGLSNYYWEHNDATKANEIYLRALAVSKDYIPLLKLALEIR